MNDEEFYNTAVIAAEVATAHNEGQTVLEHHILCGIVSIKMSSWPRAQEAGKYFEKCGWQWRMGENDMGQWIQVRRVPNESATS